VAKTIPSDGMREGPALAGCVPYRSTTTRSWPFHGMTSSSLQPLDAEVRGGCRHARSGWALVGQSVELSKGVGEFFVVEGYGVGPDAQGGGDIAVASAGAGLQDLACGYQVGACGVPQPLQAGVGVSGGVGEFLESLPEAVGAGGA
jgi:hypothetical protein